MEFKGTKGEWKVINGWNEKGEGEYFPSVVLFDHENTSTAYGINRIVINISHNQEKESLMANAKLIAAAPDLLEAAKEINRWLSVNFPEHGGEHDFGRCASFNQLRSAILKALK